MRTLLLGVAAFALALTFARAYLLSWWEDQRHIAALSPVNAQIFREPRGQFFFRQFVGDSLSQRAVYVHLDDARVDDECLRRVASLKYVEVLSIKSTKVTDAGLVHLAGMRDLRDLNLVDTQVTEAGLARLSKALPALRMVRSERRSATTLPQAIPAP